MASFYIFMYIKLLFRNPFSTEILLLVPCYIAVTEVMFALILFRRRLHARYIDYVKNCLC